MESTTNKAKKLYVGTVVSDKMDKTIVVKTVMTYKHPLIHKIMRKTKKYKVHDENGTARMNDEVEFFEGRPLSKEKYMYLSRVVKSHAV